MLPSTRMIYPFFDFFSQIQTEKIMALLKTGVSGLFKYFGSPSPRMRPEKPITLPRTSMTGNMRRLREGVVHAAGLAVLHEAGLEHLLIAVPLPAHRVRERFPRIGRKAETEARDHRRRNGAAADIVLCRGTLRRFEHIMEKPRRVPVELNSRARRDVSSLCASSGRGMFARRARNATASGNERFSISMMKLMTPPPLPQPKQW